MPKVTISAILTIIRIVLSLLLKVARMSYSVLDLLDDGIINQSAEKPAWYQSVVSFISQIENATSSLSMIEDEINGI